MVKSVWYGLAIGAAVLLPVSSAFAATATSTLNVTLTITGGCTVVTTTPVNFGIQNFINSNLTAQGSLSVICSLSLPYTIGLNGGQSGNVNGRQMMNGSNAVAYQLYQDSAYTVPWGNSTGSYLQSTGTGLAQIIPVYGLVTGPQAVLAGLYTDTVTVTVNY